MALSDSKQEWSHVVGGELRGHHESVLDAAARTTDGTPIMPWFRPPPPGSWGAAKKEDADRRSRSRQHRRSRSRKGSSKGAGKGDKGADSRAKKEGQEKKQIVGQLSVHQVGSDGKRTKLCGAYNGKNGCRAKTDRDCPQRGEHKCGYILSQDGRVCGRRDHGYQNHRK